MIQNKESYYYLLKTPEKNKKDPQRGGRYFLLSQLPEPIILSREMETPEKKKKNGLPMGMVHANKLLYCN